MDRFNKSVLSSMTLLLVFSLLVFGCIPNAKASTINVDRLYGQDAYETSTTIANAVHAGTVDNVVLASGITFPDALSGSVLAKQKNAPILLVDRTVKSSGDAFEYIKSHLKNDGTIYILGGTGIIPAEFETALNDLGYNKIIRRGGWDQYDTALLIAKEKQAPIGTPVVIVTGEHFPDALSFSSIAANKGWPILLTQKTSLSDKVKEYLAAQNPTIVYIAGGTGVISDITLKQVHSAVPSAIIHRISGWNQYDTSMAIAKEFSPSPSHVYVASGKNFPDALAGSVLAAQTGSPIVLINPESMNLPSSVVDYTQSFPCNSVSSITLLGGSYVVPDWLVLKIQALLSGATTANVLLGSLEKVNGNIYAEYDDYVWVMPGDEEGIAELIKRNIPLEFNNDYQTYDATPDQNVKLEIASNALVSVLEWDPSLGFVDKPISVEELYKGYTLGTLYNTPKYEIQIKNNKIIQIKMVYTP